MDYIFLTLEMILKIHADHIERYGGSFGVRDQGLLESAIEMPKMTFGEQFVHEDIFEMAAAYLFHLCKNHAFVDGNKRVAASASWIFLKLNGIEISPDENEFYDVVIAVAEGRLNKKDIAAFFANNISPHHF